MKNIVIFLLLITIRLSAQNVELVEQFSTSTYNSKSYIYTKEVKLVPPNGGGTLSISAATNGTFFIRPAQAATIPTNVPPSADKNFVRVERINVSGVSSEDLINSLNSTQRTTAYQYVDGVGRTSEDVQLRASPGQRDEVKYYNYDATTGRIIKDYLPYASNDKNGAFKTVNETTITDFYNGTGAIASDQGPFSQAEYEISSLNRIKKMYGPGKAWKDNLHANETSTQINTADAIRRWKINASTSRPESDVFYPASTLLVSVSSDEESYGTKSYTDYRGNTVMTERSGLITYYVYDVMGNLRYVLPPEVSKLYNQSLPIQLASPDQTILDKWAFQYKYDGRQRLSQEKGPGTHNDWIYYLYDQWDRVVATQDGAQRQKSPKEWSFTKYDIVNRPVMKGVLKTSSDSYLAMSGAVNGSRYEDISTSDVIGYTTTNTFPNTSSNGFSSVEILSVNYYDSYYFKSITNWSANNSLYDADAGLSLIPTVEGQLTGSKVKRLGENAWLCSVIYYDDHYRAVQTIEANHLSNTPDRNVVTYDFVGKALQTQRKHYNPYISSTITITDNFDYDHAGRLLRQYHQIDNGPKVLLAGYNYNEAGQLIETNLHSTDNGNNFLQSVDYRYNIRGWLTSINNYQLNNDNGTTNNDNNDLFGLNLTYNSESFDVNGYSTPQLFDGRITAARWSSNNLKDAVKQNVYGYGYANHQRFASAKYASNNAGNWNGDAGMYDLSTTYNDDHGNIKTVQRYAKVADTKTQVDNLSYTYAGNELTGVDDLTNNHLGYPDKLDDTNIPVEMDYDMSGNLKSDLNCEITSVTYNYLNLPETITIDLPGSSEDKLIQFKYDASGYMFQKTYSKGGQLVRTVDYVQGIQYYDQKLAIVFTDHGRATAYNGGYEYEYFIKDHLSNTRIVFGNLHETDVYKATMEDDAGVASKEEQQFKNIASSRGVGYNHTSNSFASPTPDNAARLNGWSGPGIPAVPVGPAKMLQVKSGDRVQLEVYAKYGTLTSNTSVVGNIASAVASALQIGSGEQAYSALSTNLPLYSPSQKTNAPKAYLYYILFNNNYAYVQWGRKEVDATAQVAPQLLDLDFTVPVDGFVYTYVANESNISDATAVYFDDFKITHHKSTYALRVTEALDYDPYGMVLEGTHYVDESRITNSYRYQGDFAEFDSWTGWERFEGRGNYDPRLGRWHSKDPANQFMHISPYAGMGNNPVLITDPDGRILPVIMAGAALVGGIGNIWSNWDNLHGSFGDKFMQGLNYGAIGAVSGMVATVNPLAAATILTAGNATMSIMANGLPDNPGEWGAFATNAVMDFASTYFPAKAAQKYAQATEQIYGELSAHQLRMTKKAAQETTKKLAESIDEAARLAKEEVEQLSNTDLVKKAGQKAFDAIPGKGPVIGTARHEYATEWLKGVQQKYGYRGLEFKVRSFDGKAILDVQDVFHNTIYDWKFGAKARFSFRQNLKYQTYFPDNQILPFFYR